MTVQLHSRDASIVDAVMNRSHGRFERAFVDRRVAAHVDEFEGAPVQDFVEVLVIKETMDELRKLDATPKESEADGAFLTKMNLTLSRGQAVGR